MNTYSIRIEGLVQGVGFRPFVYKLAGSLRLCGTVENRNNGVYIFVSTDARSLENFIEKIKALAPQHSKIDKITVERIENKSFSEFSIVTSGGISDDITNISPDIAVCHDCLSDMELQDHRKGYPLINCTNCGPRFSIIKGVPYDRVATTMAKFEMCEICSKEYTDITNRRFHAQPVACNNCGPTYSIHLFSPTVGGDAAKRQRGVITNVINKSISDIVKMVSQLIEDGSVVALKGTGGYHLICDANNEKTILNLRINKTREAKPFAVMCRDISTVEKIAFLNNKEREVITSWRRPVLLLDSKGLLAPSVSNRLGTVGVILPYMPFHYLLFKELKTDTIVFTSANFSDEPVIISDDIALAELHKLATAILTYNREIFNRTDDSVCRVIKGNEFIIRRSRGYAPSPVNLKLLTEGIFGAGAELTNCFAIGKGKNVILSQHIGDLKNAETLDFYKTSFERFSEMFRFKPKIIAKDLHPDYLSSSFAEQLATELNIAVEQVQHHHAHIASCMADNGLNEKIIGVALDGVGLGTDGNIWGGEFMVADLCNFERFMHFEYVTISGADKISAEPWRSGVAYLNKYVEDLITATGSLKLKEIGDDRILLYQKLLETGVNTCRYSGAGRLFDAVAAITGVCLFSSYHAEAPMLLESIIKPGIYSSYDFEIKENEISFEKTIVAILSDLEKGKPVGEISAAFHNTVARVVVEAVKIISQMSGIRKIVLSGGTFQNKYLSEKIITELSDEKYFVYFHNQVPCNDGGLAMGQVAVAAARQAG
ncbi:MAG TPA: carbamoyltransferase HypF [Bacteroidales bacterium]|nr:carbamoyltransferase HypF [Bacteroidales bacterium]